MPTWVPMGLGYQIVNKLCGLCCGLKKEYNGEHVIFNSQSYFTLRVS